MFSETLQPVSLEQISEGASLFDLLFDQEVVSISYAETPSFDTSVGTPQAQPESGAGVVSVGQTIVPIFESPSELHVYFKTIQQKNRNLTRYLEWMALLGSLSCLFHFHGVSTPSVGAPSLPGALGWENDPNQKYQPEHAQHERSPKHHQKSSSPRHSSASWSHLPPPNKSSDLNWLLPEQTQGFFQFLASTLARNSIGLSNLLGAN